MEEMTSGSSQIVRRRQLPSPGVGDTFSALSLFRKNVGKDLSNISMPITMNEPLNMLQRACEELEYSELLDKAAGLSNSLDRLVHVAVFAVSGYASTQYRTGRKVSAIYKLEGLVLHLKRLLINACTEKSHLIR